MSITGTTTTRFAAGALTFAALTGLAMTTASASAQTPAAPAGLKVVRAGADLQTLNISWKPVTGAARYTVNIFDGVHHTAYNVAADKTNFVFQGSGNCTRYRVNVIAVDSRGGSAVTADALLAPLAPGGISNPKVDRSDDGGTVSLGWTAPASGGSYAPVTSYKVLFRSLVDNAVLVQRDSADTTETVKGLDPARSYAAEIVPSNAFGSCQTSKLLVRGPQPAAPSELKVVRDGNEGHDVNISWRNPAWTGYGPASKVQVGVRNPSMKDPKWTDLPAGSTSAKLSLANSSKWSVWVRVVNGNAYGQLTKEYFLAKAGGSGAPTIDPNVTINNTDGVVQVHFGAPVGSIASYPKVNVSIAPTTTDNGFSAHQDAFNRAQTFTFDSVPCGAYTVVVTGYGEQGSSEFGRKMITRCDSGLVPANQWKLISGAAKIEGNLVGFTAAGENRVVSTVPRTSTDMVYSTQATLSTGRGYGIWSRATLGAYNQVSGYSFQYDPGYQYVDSKFGKALLLRVWQDGRECGTPIAKVQWPSGLKVDGTHEVTVVTRGDTLFATIDGTKMFDVPSLKTALANSNCSMKEPTGSQVGFRTWGDTQATFSNTTIN